MVAAVAGVAALVEGAGGLPSQLAHLYYVPVVAGALLLPRRMSLAIALLAGVAVSPLPDVVHRAIGAAPYYSDASPWNVTSDGWIVRPVAFVIVSLLASSLVRERVGRIEASRTSAVRGEELGILGRIDKMILRGATEEESIAQIGALVARLTGARMAAVVMPGDDGARVQTLHGYVSDLRDQVVLERGLPIDEGVSGEALREGRTAIAGNVREDPRYNLLRRVAERVGYNSAAAAPLVLEDVVIGALVIGYSEERDFSADELGRLERLAAQAALAIGHARQRQALESLARRTAVALAGAIESRDTYTGLHCSRLANYAAMVATEAGLSAEETDIVRLGAALHDVGKIAVPDSILLKPGPLTPEEFEIMKEHPRRGAAMCRDIALDSGLDRIVEHHHERYDGAGYPDGLAGDDIPLGARIVSVVDAYDAMTTDRPYRSALPHERAIAILREGAGTQWDPRIVRTFLSLLAEDVSEQAA